MFVEFQPEKKRILTYTKDGFFMSENGPNSPDFKEKKIQMTRFL